MNRSELIKPVEYTKNIDGYRVTKFVDNTELIEFITDSIIICVDEWEFYSTPFSETEYYFASIKSRMPNGENIIHSAAIEKKMYHHPVINELFQPKEEVCTAISVRGDYVGASCIEFPGRIDLRQLEKRNEFYFSFPANQQPLKIDKKYLDQLSKKLINNKEFKLMELEEILEDSVLGILSLFEPINPAKGTTLEKAILDFIAAHCEEMKAKFLQNNSVKELSDDEIEAMVSRVSLKFRLKYSY